MQIFCIQISKVSIILFFTPNLICLQKIPNGAIFTVLAQKSPVFDKENKAQIYLFSTLLLKTIRIFVQHRLSDKATFFLNIHRWIFRKTLQSH